MAAIGDAYSQFGSVLAAAALEIKPSSGQEVVIHNVYHEGAVALRLVDGAGNELAFTAEAGANFLTNMYLHLTNTQYLRVYNTEAGAKYIAADGIYTKA